MDMDIRSSFEGLKSILGVTPAAPSVPQAKNTVASPSSTLWGSDQATLSSAGSAVNSASADSGVRMDKISAIQSALAAGTYQVSASAVASRVVDSMLGAQ
jgi:flagellar biosynthesis anti-sigma factor FlgM